MSDQIEKLESSNHGYKSANKRLSNENSRLKRELEMLQHPTEDALFTEIEPPADTTPVDVNVNDFPKATEEKKEENKKNDMKPSLWWLLWLLLAIIVGLIIWNSSRLQKTAALAAPTETPAISTEVPTAAPTAAPTEAQVVIEKINYNEPLKGSLDDFGNATRYSDRFALNGTILDESLNSGEMIFGNAYALHDNGWVGESCVVFYYKAGSEGGRVRATGFDGIFFTVDTNKMTLNQGIASMRQTLINAHACTFEEIKFHELTRYGDPVKK